MWLKDSSIGRKLIMSITGLCLVLFLLFHASMNIALIFSEEAYNWICEMLGANWYAVAASLVLALGVLIHILYALYLTILNRRARGNDRYAVTAHQEGVEWNSKNMLVLGFIVFGFIVLHMVNFWGKMQFAELTGLELGAFHPQNGASYVKYLFSGVYDPALVLPGVAFTPWPLWVHPLYCALYIVWLVAIWFHLTHGIWSALQTLGWSNTIWLKRIQVISKIVATLIVLMFAAVVFYYLGVFIGAHCWA